MGSSLPRSDWLQHAEAFMPSCFCVCCWEGEKCLIRTHYSRSPPSKDWAPARQCCPQRLCGHSTRSKRSLLFSLPLNTRMRAAYYSSAAAAEMQRHGRDVNVDLWAGCMVLLCTQQLSSVPKTRRPHALIQRRSSPLSELLALLPVSLRTPRVAMAQACNA
ncbi:hypothetical protein GQ54DRAFT_167733 [Martensiomyces pterosporus]|nr:hypothetical protein GQ54DRAFT_167733 [Martensiomyces pterosporus]